MHYFFSNHIVFVEVSCPERVEWPNSIFWFYNFSTLDTIKFVVFPKSWHQYDVKSLTKKQNVTFIVISILQQKF